MSALYLLAMAAGVAVLTVLVPRLLREQTRRRRELFDALGREFGGGAREDLSGLLSFMHGLAAHSLTLLLPLHGTEAGARMRFYSTGGKNATHYTEFTAPLPDPGWNLFVYPEGFAQKVAQIFGAQDVKTGDPDFDAEFAVKSSVELACADTLRRADAQEALLALKRLTGNGHTDLSVDGGKFRAQSLRLYRNFPGAHAPV